MATTVTSPFSTNATNTCTFNSAVSSFTATIGASGLIDSNFTTGILSGSNTVYSGTLTFVLTAIAGNTIAGGDTSILLTIPSSVGNNLFYGFVAGSSYIPATRIAKFAIQFYGSDYISTTINLSANGVSNVVVADPTLSSPFDIAFQYIPGLDNDVLGNNVSYIHTVSDYLRRLNLNG